MQHPLKPWLLYKMLCMMLFFSEEMMVSNFLEWKATKREAYLEPDTLMISKFLRVPINILSFFLCLKIKPPQKSKFDIRWFLWKCSNFVDKIKRKGCVNVNELFRFSRLFEAFFYNLTQNSKGLKYFKTLYKTLIIKNQLFIKNISKSEYL